MKRIFSLFCAVLLLLSFAACSSERPLTSTAEYDNCTLELTDGTFEAAEDGTSLLRVTAAYTNKNAEPLYALSSFSVKAFQNGAEIQDISDINGKEASLIQEVKDGNSLTVSYLFELTDSSDVEVLVCAPTADADTLAKVTYSN